MKRTLLTGLFVLAAAAIVSQMLRLESRAVAEKPSHFAEAVADSTHSFNAFPATAKKTRIIKVPVYRKEFIEKVVAISDESPPSLLFSELMLQKAQRMSEEELAEAIKAVKAELEAQDEAAQTELQQAIHILEQIVETSAGTSAADRARVALQVLKEPVPVYQPGRPFPPQN